MNTEHLLHELNDIVDHSSIEEQKEILRLLNDLSSTIKSRIEESVIDRAIEEYEPSICFLLNSVERDIVRNNVKLMFNICKELRDL